MADAPDKKQEPGKQDASSSKPTADPVNKTVILPPEKLEPKKEEKNPDPKANDKASDPASKTVVLSRDKFGVKQDEIPRDERKSPRDDASSKPSPGDPSRTMVIPPEKPESKKDVLPKAEAASALPAKARRPFPWPIFLAILIPLGVGGVLAYEWMQQDQVQMARSGWIAICSFVPGFSVMVAIGSLAQIRRRPILSLFALLLAVAYTYGSWWAFQFIVQNKDSLLR